MDMIGDLAARRGKTILTVVHDLNLALRSASRLFFVKDGTVAYSVTPEEVSGEIVRDVYGVEAIVKRDPATGVRFVIPAARTPGPIR
jgi:iron complex transport system ATP-binding protein